MAVLLYSSLYLFNFSDNDLQMKGYENPGDALKRIVLFAIAFAAIYALRMIIPDRNIPLITKFGKNSLWIYILHRPFTLIIDDFIMDLPTALLIASALLISLLLCVLLGNDLTAGFFDRFADSGTDLILCRDDKKSKINFSRIAVLIVCSGFIFSAVLQSTAGIYLNDILNPQDKTTVNNNSEPEVTSTIICHQILRNT